MTTEVMFWMDHTEGARPAGQIVDQVPLYGVKYELWRRSSLRLNRGMRIVSRRWHARSVEKV